MNQWILFIEGTPSINPTSTGISKISLLEVPSFIVPQGKCQRKNFHFRQMRICRVEQNVI